MKENKRLNKGITLIALIVTIVIMLILAGVTINVTVDGGLFGKAQSAKNSMEKAQDREKITKAIIYAKEKDRSGKLTVENLQKELSDANVLEEAGTIIVKLNGTYYEIGENGKIEELGGAIEKELKIICKDSSGNPLKNSNGNIIPEKIYKIVKSKYSLLPPEIEDYEPLEEKLEGEISENKEITLTYYKILDDDTELVFTGLKSDKSTNSTNENEIEYYMIGDGVTANGGLTTKGKGFIGILKVPGTYNGKPVIKIAKSAFQKNNTIIKADIQQNVQTIGVSVFHDAHGLKQLIIGEKVNKIESNAFTTASGLKKVTFKCKISDFGSVFTNTGSWTEIGEESNNGFYKVIDNVLYSSDGKTLIIVPKGKSKVKIAEGTTKLEANAFCRNYGITELEIPDSVETIGNYCFGWDSQIKSYIIGSNVKTIDSYAFHMDSSKLENLYIKSEYVSGMLTSKTSAGKLISFGVPNIYIEKNIKNIGSYITENYTETTSDKDGYIKYVKNS